MQGQASESLPRRQTDPLWIQHHFLSSGHDESTRNATATFVKRKGRHYMVTCRHVLQIVEDRRTTAGEAQLTMALQIDRAILNLSYISPQGIMLSVRAPEAELRSEEVDIALAPLESGHWAQLCSRKNKVAIDLDSWREPDWATLRHCLAAGYQDEGKYKTLSEGAEKVATPFLEVVAELCSAAGRDTNGFLLIHDTPPVGMYVLNMFRMRGSRLWGSRLHRACVV